MQNSTTFKKNKLSTLQVALLFQIAIVIIVATIYIQIPHCRKTFVEIDQISETKIAIVIPFTENDIPRLRRVISIWNNGKIIPCSTKFKTISIFFLFSKNLTLKPEILKEIKQEIFSTSRISSCVNSIEYISANLTEKEDVYKDTKYAVGPNNMFYKIFSMEEFRSFDYAFIMESDTVPIRDLWIDCLYKQVVMNSQEFWMKGTLCNDCKGPLNNTVSFHMNGNAIYNLKSEEFKKLITMWRDRKSSAAYDVVIHKLRVLQVDSMYAKQIWHKFMYSSFILSLGAYTPWIIAETNPETCFVHSKAPIDLSYWLN